MSSKGLLWQLERENTSNSKASTTTSPRLQPNVFTNDSCVGVFSSHAHSKIFRNKKTTRHYIVSKLPSDALVKLMNCCTKPRNDAESFILQPLLPFASVESGSESLTIVFDHWGSDELEDVLLRSVKRKTRFSFVSIGFNLLGGLTSFNIANAPFTPKLKHV